MAVEVIFFGGAGDYEQGELGGVQGLFHDTERKTKFLLECGQRPDHTSRYFGYPYRVKPYNALEQIIEFEFFPDIAGIYRHDYEWHRGRKVGPIPDDFYGILATHGHYDHIGGFTYLRHDLPVYMHPLTLDILYVWQYTSGRTNNQFVDLISQFALHKNMDGGPDYVKGEEAVLERNIKLFENRQSFNLGGIKVTAYLVDHSLPGACGFILETSAGTIGISGDIRLRGRRREDTEQFINELAERKIDYLFWEGSLMDVPHDGTEQDVANVVSEIIKDKNFAGITFPPRDFDRITSLYEAAKNTGRMLVINYAQALGLKQLNGANGYPKLNARHIGVLLPPKGKGTLDNPDYPLELTKRDYFFAERELLKRSRWTPEREEWSESKEKNVKKGGHEPKVQRVSVEDVARYQDQFLVYMPFNYMLDLLGKIKPSSGSTYIRSHPAPWTLDLEIQEARTIELERKYGLLCDNPIDYLSPVRKVKIPTVHVTGHMNCEETIETIRRIRPRVLIPYHCKDPRYFEQKFGREIRIEVPQRKVALTLGR